MRLHRLVLRRYGGAHRHLHIVQHAQSVTAGSNTLCLTYNSEHQRITQVQTTATCASPGSGAVTTTYLNDPVSGAMEEAVLSGGVTTRRDYIQADGHIVAERMVGTVGTPTNWNAANWGSFQWAGSVSVLYFTLDHLGSIAVITDTTGAIVERDSYDSWGRQRNPNGTDNAVCSISSLTTRGYTNQEEMDQICAVNLNARIYDPTLARMTAADSTVPDPFDGQSFNRYSYVENGPLSATDPTGYRWCAVLACSTSQGMGSGLNDPDKLFRCGDDPDCNFAMILATNPRGYQYLESLASDAYQDNLSTQRSTAESKVTLVLVNRSEVPVVDGSSNPDGVTQVTASLFSDIESYTVPVNEFNSGAGGAPNIAGFNFGNVRWGQLGLGLFKMVGGGFAVSTGAALCTTGIGCVGGALIAGIGASDAIQGATQFWGALQGQTSQGYNPLKSIAQQINPTWGGLTYDAASIGATGLGFTAKADLVVDATLTGINTTKSIFGVSVSRWSNSTSVLGYVFDSNWTKAYLAATLGVKVYGAGQDFPNGP